MSDSVSIGASSDIEVSDQRGHRLYGSYLAVCRLVPEFRSKSIELHDNELLSYYNQVGNPTAEFAISVLTNQIHSSTQLRTTPAVTMSIV